MKTNRIPESYQPLLALAGQGRSGAEELAAEIGLKQTDEATLRRDLTTLTNAQFDYAQSRASHAEAREQLRTVTRTGRDFCARTIDTLKTFLGRRWNARWVPLGFTSSSIALDEDPREILADVASYLRNHPEHENAQLAITAVEAESVGASIDTARSQANAARDHEGAAKQARDTAFRRLRRRLTALRNELTLLLEPDSGHWYRFGFRRPADRRSPEPVAEVTLRQTPAGDVIAQWPPSVRADQYRVTCRTTEEASAPIFQALVESTEAILPDLPRGIPLIIGIAAYNRTGETAPTEARITIDLPLVE